MLRGTLLVMAAMAVGLAAPGLSVAQTPAQDSVTGFAVDCQFPDPCPPDLATAGLLTRLTANARSGPSGELPAGTMTKDERVVGAGIHDETQVTCLSVSDHVAVIGVTGTRSITLTVGTISVSVAGLIRVSDGGGPDSGLDTYELALEQGPLVPPPPPPPLPGPTDCSAFPGGELFHNERGDLVVTDAPPAPDPEGPVQERRLADLRRLQEPRRLRQLRDDRRQESAGSRNAVAVRTRRLDSARSRV